MALVASYVAPLTHLANVCLLAADRPGSKNEFVGFDQMGSVWRISLSNLSRNLLEATELANVLQEVSSNIQVLL